MASKAASKPRQPAQPVPPLRANPWDMLQAAMSMDSAPARPIGKTGAEIPADAPPSEPVPGRPRRARRRASVA